MILVAKARREKLSWKGKKTAQNGKPRPPAALPKALKGFSHSNRGGVQNRP